jgi:hypothetical protein
VKNVRKIGLAQTMFVLRLVTVAGAAEAQGTFQNLDFESANLAASPQEIYPNFVRINSALPGWTAYVGSIQQTQVGYNAPANSTASITLTGPTWSSSDAGRYVVDIIDGSYSVDSVSSG